MQFLKCLRSFYFSENIGWLKNCLKITFNNIKIWIKTDNTLKIYQLHPLNL